MTELFTPDFSTVPYWLDESPLASLNSPAPVNTADVVIVGAGYTGLNAALTLARAGRHVVILEAEVPGWGCSARNGGQISSSMKPGYDQLSRQLGQAKALAILAEGQRSVEWLEQFIRSEEITCDYRRCGSFHGAHTLKHFEKLRREIESESVGLRSGAQLVQSEEVRRELGTDAYVGGAIFPQDASLQPASYHQDLLRLVLAAGASVYEYCPALQIEKSANGHTVTTPQGKIHTRDVVIGTNGYTGAVTPWLRRRVIPIGSYMIATEPLSRKVMDEIMPTDRIVCDTRKVVFYYRPSPDRTRVIFGGRVAHNEENPRLSGPGLHREMCRLFPQLIETRISHSWMGYVAFTFDSLAHTGTQEGVHYAMGYCGSGIALSSYLGMRMGQKVLGLAEGATALDSVSFRTRALYTGKPWFLGAAVKYYQLQDRIGW